MVGCVPEPKPSEISTAGVGSRTSRTLGPFTTARDCEPARNNILDSADECGSTHMRRTSPDNSACRCQVCPKSRDKKSTGLSLDPPVTYKTRELAGSITIAAISPTRSDGARMISSAWSEFILTPCTDAGEGETRFQFSPPSTLRQRPVACAYIVLGSRGSKAKKSTTPRRLNIRHVRPPSCVM